MKKPSGQQLVIIGVLCTAIIAYLIWDNTRGNIPDGFYTGNGRIEATEIDIATKLAGRIEHILVDEGDFVSRGQPLAIMQTDVLTAQLFEAEAQMHAAVAALARSKANIILRDSDREATIAIVAQRESQLDAGQRRLNRSSKLSKTGAMAIQQFDDDETAVAGAKAAVDTAKAQVTVAEAALEAAKADSAGAEANVKAAEATVARIKADIKDSTLIAPCDGRIQYRISQPGEVLSAGGKVLNLVDLSDVYMTFFLPSAEAGRIKIGNEARIVLDAAPEYPVPAHVSFVSSVAQFTPKTVETHSEREKLMFRIKAQIDRDLLRSYIQYVKTGLPGVTWVKISDAAEWPAKLTLTEPPVAQSTPAKSGDTANTETNTASVSASTAATPLTPASAGTLASPTAPELDAMAEQQGTSATSPQNGQSHEQPANPQDTGTTSQHNPSTPTAPQSADAKGTE